MAVLSGCCLPGRDSASAPIREGSVERHENGELSRAFLVRADDLGGLLCRGWVRWHENGRLESVALAGDTRVQRHEFPGGTRLNFDAEGRLRSAWLSRAAVIGGHLCRGCPKMETSFYADGAVAAFFPAGDVEIDGVRCVGSIFRPVRLHPNGKLKSAKLAADCTIESRRFEKGDVLTLDAGGHPTR
ncbi:MAG: hypothetical protein HYY18_00765 [Planctomycetes bacterium]|nr:hypothetical protein [Planctomycetota bacterium]